MFNILYHIECNILFPIMKYSIISHHSVNILYHHNVQYSPSLHNVQCGPEKNKPKLVKVIYPQT